MKKIWFLLCASLGLVLLLSACGTAPDSDNPAENTENNELDEQVDESKENEIDNEVDAEDNSDKTDDKDEGENSNSQSEEEFLAKAKLVTSDMQNFSMYLLPEYTLTSEEPGRDILYLEEDSSIFMRIETMSSDDIVVEDLKENTIDLLEGSSNGETPVALDFPKDDQIENITGYTVEAEDAVVSGIVLERDDFIVRLTIFDTDQEEYFEDFWEMGLTVSKSE